jgi:prolyl-tRNA synthetase
MLESAAGEDTCAVCPKCNYAANLEVAASKMGSLARVAENPAIEEVSTPNVKTIDDLKKFLGVPEAKLAKSLVYVDGKKPVLILMVGNDQLNESKLQAVLGPDARPSHADELKALTGADGGSIGPIGLKDFRIIADKRLEGANGLISGANRNDVHLKNIDLARDVKVEGYYDLRTAAEGEPCPSCNSPLRIVNAIELGHIFKLGTKYADALKAYFLEEDGKENPIIMGSYGIGIERIVACHIEQYHDANGIIWTKALCPYQVQLIMVNSKNEPVVKAAEEMYTALTKANIEVLFDDRKDASPGFKFKDADLLGMPLQVIVGEKNLSAGNTEIKERATGKREILPVSNVVGYVKAYFS